MTPKILILVLSYMKPPYDSLLKVQRETWDSVEADGVKTVYYYGGGKGWVNDKEFSADSEDKYYWMSDKLLGCLKEVIDWDWQICFRTNSSSYVNKERLIEFANTLNTEKLYCGWSLETCVSGAGFFISKDCAKILVDELNPKYEKEEDFAVGEILLTHGIEIVDDKSRIDWPEYDKDIHTAYHLRFKGPHGNRYRDADDMRLVHQKIMNGK